MQMENRFYLSLLAKIDSLTSLVGSFQSEHRAHITITTNLTSAVHALRTEVAALKTGPPTIASAQPKAKPATTSTSYAQAASQPGSAQAGSNPRPPVRKAKAPKPTPLAKPEYSRKERTVTLVASGDRPDTTRDAVLTAVNVAIAPHQFVRYFRSGKDNVYFFTHPHVSASEALTLAAPITNAVHALCFSCVPPMVSNN